MPTLPPRKRGGEGKGEEGKKEGGREKYTNQLGGVESYPDHFYHLEFGPKSWVGHR